MQTYSEISSPVLARETDCESGIVRGIVVREKAREDAFDRMLQHAAEKGATTVLCHGTTVQVKRA